MIVVNKSIVSKLDDKVKIISVALDRAHEIIETLENENKRLSDLMESIEKNYSHEELVTC